MSNAKPCFVTTGYTIAEAVRNAERWWDMRGRHLINRQTNQDIVGRKFVPAGKNSPSILIPGNKETVIPSGILTASPWAGLDSRERLFITKVWHLEFVEKPMFDPHYNDRSRVTH